LDDRSSEAIRRLGSIVLVGCVVVIALSVAIAASPALRARLFPGTVEAPSYRVNDYVDVSASAFDGHSKTLIYFSTPTCAACARSEGALSGLVRHAMSHDIGVVLVRPEGVGSDNAMFSERTGVDVSHVLSLDLGHLRVRRVPTLLIVDRTGKVLMYHEGVLTDTDTREVAEALN
jgi:hypothetical protein